MRSAVITLGGKVFLYRVMSKLHPAKALFEQLFRKAAATDSPYQSGDLVPRNFFHKKCREAGIDCPENFIAALEWETKIGLHGFVKKLCRLRDKGALNPPKSGRG